MNVCLPRQAHVAPQQLLAECNHLLRRGVPGRIRELEVIEVEIARGPGNLLDQVLRRTLSQRIAAAVERARHDPLCTEGAAERTDADALETGNAPADLLLTQINGTPVPNQIAVG